MQLKAKILIAVTLCSVSFGLAGYSSYWRQNRLNRELLDAVEARRGVYTVRNLVRAGANPNAVGGNEYDTALFRAIQTGSVPTVQALLVDGASVHPIGEAHEGPATALACYQSMNALNYPDLSVSDYLALFVDFQRHGESIEEQDVLGDTPLMRAVWSGNPKAAEALLKLGANSYVVNNYHQTIWDWTGNYPDKQEKLRRLLLKYGALAKETVR